MKGYRKVIEMKPKRIYIMSVIVVILFSGRPLYAQAVDVFINNFVFKNFTDAQTAWESILAAEAQQALQNFENIRVFTSENLESQLKQEKMKELLSCDEANCISQIIENFGIADSIFGTITNIGNSEGYQIYITYTRQQEVIRTKTQIVEQEFKITECAQHIKALLSRMLVEQGYAIKEAAPPADSKEHDTVKESPILSVADTKNPVTEKPPLPTTPSSVVTKSKFWPITTIVAGSLLLLGGIGLYSTAKDIDNELESWNTDDSNPYDINTKIGLGRDAAKSSTGMYVLGTLGVAGGITWLYW